MSDKSKVPHALLWVDAETTGLEPSEDMLLEVAWRLTRFEYPYEPVLDAAGKQVMGHWLFTLPDGGVGVRSMMGDPVVVEMHTKSGLLAELDARTDGDDYPLQIEALTETLLALSEDWPGDKDRKVMIAGNSVGFDLGFLRAHMPRFAHRLSYRVFDASSYYRFCLSLGMPPLPKPEEAHRAEEDLLRSIELARTCGRWVLREQ